MYDLFIFNERGNAETCTVLAIDRDNVLTLLSHTTHKQFTRPLSDCHGQKAIAIERALPIVRNMLRNRHTVSKSELRRTIRVFRSVKTGN